jgi:hypothetical protein
MRPNQFHQKTRRTSTSGFGLTLLVLLATLVPAGTAGAAAPVPL